MNVICKSLIVLCSQGYVTKMAASTYIYLLIDAIFIWVGFLELILVFCNNFYYSKYGNYSLVSHEKFAEFGYKRLYKSMNFVIHAL